MSAATSRFAPIATLNKADIEKLKKLATASENGRHRYCMHRDHQDPIQEMMICLAGPNYFEPHRHPSGVSESYHMIAGEMDVYTFDEEGSATSCTRLAELSLCTDATYFFHKVSCSVYHTVVPRTPFVIYHEVLTGPFKQGYTCETAPFAPQQDDPVAIEKLQKALDNYGKN